MTKIVEIYELFEEDHHGILQRTGKYFKSYQEAMKLWIDINPKNLKEKLAIELDDGSYLFLQSATPVYLYNSSYERKKRAEELIRRLTPEEYEIMEEYFGSERC